MLTFLDLQTEVKRRATKDQGGTEFDSGVKTLINTSLFRIARECPWRVLRRKAFFNTETTYSTGSGSVTVTAASVSFSVVGATFITDNIQVGRRIQFGTDSNYYTIRTITSETAGTIDQAYLGTSSTTTSYAILPTEEYNLPIQVNPTRDFIWHNAYGYPVQLNYITDQDFRSFNMNDTTISKPLAYRMWGQNTVITQPVQASVMRVSSSSSSDTAISITVFGIVSGYPDYEIIMTDPSNGTTAVPGSKVFSSVERVAKGSPTVGRVTVDANSAADIVAVLPVGDTTASIMYSKCQLWPLPDGVYPINVQYYKDPWRLVNPNDIHEMGADFDEAIILLATAKIKYESSLNDDGDKFFAMYQDEVKTLRRTNMDKIDWLETLKRPQDSRRSAMRFLNGRGLLYGQIGQGGQFGPMSWR